MQRRWATRQFKTRAGVALAEFVSHRKGRRIVDFRDDWSDACTAAGVTGLHFHDLRRSAVRNMDKAGVSETVVMKVSGHKSRPRTEGAAVAAPGYLRDLMAGSTGIEPATSGLTVLTFNRPRRACFQ